MADSLFGLTPQQAKSERFAKTAQIFGQTPLGTAIGVAGGQAAGDLINAGLGTEDPRIARAKKMQEIQRKVLSQTSVEQDDFLPILEREFNAAGIPLPIEARDKLGKLRKQTLDIKGKQVSNARDSIKLAEETRELNRIESLQPYEREFERVFSEASKGNQNFLWLARNAVAKQDQNGNALTPRQWMDQVVDIAAKAALGPSRKVTSTTYDDFGNARATSMVDVPNAYLRGIMDSAESSGVRPRQSSLALAGAIDASPRMRAAYGVAESSGPAASQQPPAQQPAERPQEGVSQAFGRDSDISRIEGNTLVIEPPGKPQPGIAVKQLERAQAFEGSAAAVLDRINSLAELVEQYGTLSGSIRLPESSVRGTAVGGGSLPLGWITGADRSNKVAELNSAYASLISALQGMREGRTAANVREMIPDPTDVTSAWDSDSSILKRLATVYRDISKDAEGVAKSTKNRIELPAPAEPLAVINSIRSLPSGLVDALRQGGREAADTRAPSDPTDSAFSLQMSPWLGLFGDYGNTKASIDNYLEYAAGQLSQMLGREITPRQAGMLLDIERSSDIGTKPTRPAANGADEKQAARESAINESIVRQAQDQEARRKARRAVK